MLLPGFPHADVSEIVIALFALSGLVFHLLNFFDIVKDGISVAQIYEHDPSLRYTQEIHDYRTAVNFNLLGETMLVCIQFVLCIIAYRSLFTPPPPPAWWYGSVEVEMIFYEAWLNYHIGVLLISALCDVSGIIARIGRRRLRRTP